MKDDAVERVLAGLGKVEAPTGLEGRVLRRMAEAGSRRSSGFGLGFRMASGLALAGVLAWCVWILGSDGGRHTPGAKARIVGGEERPRKPEAEALGYLQATTTTGDELVEERGGHTPGAKAPFAGRAERAKRPKAEALGYLQAKALPGELESFPAPPEPLTEQERLLVRIARHPQRSDAQFLIAEVREAELARGNAEFERFFPPPKAEEEIVVSQPVQAKENHNEVEPKDR